MRLSILVLYYVLIIETYKIPSPRLKRNAENNQKTPTKPNIVIITSSELGWDDISQHGSPLALTPNLHTLSKHGIHFSHHYISPWDFSSRVELFTGEYASHQGLQHGNITNDQPIGLNQQTKILPEYLKELGYSTKFVGKWGLGFYDKQMIPTNRGFDYFKGSLGFDAIDYYSYTSKTRYEGYDLYENENVFYPKENVHYTELITDEACDIIVNHNKNKSPLYLHVSYQSPQIATSYSSHKSQVPQRWTKPFENIFNDTDKIEHSGMVLSLDVAIGKVMDAITEANIFDNTIILFLSTSTSQSCSTFNGVGCNYPLKGGKGTYWDGGLRSMALLFSNEIKNPGKTIEDNIHITDWLPTLLKMASLNSPSKFNNFHGFDLTDVIANGAKSKREFILHGYDPLANNSGAIRVRDYKLVMNQTVDEKSDWTKYFPYDRNKTNDLIIPGFRPVSHLKSDVSSIILCDSGFPHPYLRLRAPPCVPSHRPCLFNILWDPCEYHNLAEFMPKTTTYLYDHTKMIINSGYIKNPIYPDSDPYSNPKNFNNTWTFWKSLNSTTNKTLLSSLQSPQINNLMKFWDEIDINTPNKTQSNSIDSTLYESSHNIMVPNKTKEYSSDTIDRNLIPYQLINEDELDIFNKNQSQYLFGDYTTGNKILKISCEELDYYNYSIECVNSSDSVPTDIKTNNLTKINNILDLTKNQSVIDTNKTNSIIVNDAITTTAAIDQQPNTTFTSSSIINNDPFKESINNIIQNISLANISNYNNPSNNEDLSVIPLKNNTQLTDTNITINSNNDIPMNVERFNLEAKPERAINGNETTNKITAINKGVTSSAQEIQNTFSTTSMPTSIPNNFHQQANKNETDVNESINEKIKSSFKSAKGQGSIKIIGPYDDKNSSLKLLTNAIAGNVTDEKTKQYPENLTSNNVADNNPNIDWHLTSKAKSVEFKPNITRDDYSSFSSNNWSSYTEPTNMTKYYSNFTSFKPDVREYGNKDSAISSNVTAIANANKGENTNIHSISLNPDGDKPKPINDINITKPSYEPIKNYTHNNLNNSSQKSIIVDGDSFRSLEVINEPLSQNQTTQWNNIDCDCDSNSEQGFICDKCSEKIPKEYDITNIPYDPTKIIPTTNIEEGVNPIHNHRTDGIPFSGQIELSNKKFNVEGTVIETPLSKSSSDGEYSFSANNDNIVGMSLLKNGGYDPKEQNKDQPLQIMESSANIKLVPTSEQLKIKDKNKTKTIRTKKGKIELVGDLGDYNDDVTTTPRPSSSLSTLKNDTFSSVMSKLETILDNGMNISNTNLNNIQNIFKSNMSIPDKSKEFILANLPDPLHNTTLNLNETLNHQTNSTSTANSTFVNSVGQKKDLVGSHEFSTFDNTGNDYYQANNGVKSNQIATVIAIVLAGMIIIGMGVVAVVAVISKSMYSNYFTPTSSNKQPDQTRRKSSPRSSKLKEKIPFNS